MNYLKIKLGIFSLLVIFAVSVFLISCEQSMIDTETDIIDQQISQTPTLDAANLPTEEKYPSVLIATIQKDGHEIKFHSTGSPENSGIFMEESLYGTALRNQEEYHLAKDEEGSNPFDVFVAVTDTEVSIPKAIAKSAKDNLLELSGRKVMEIGNSLELLDPNYSEEEANIRYRGCSGDVGYENFIKWYCKTSHPWNINVCDPSKNTEIRRYSDFNGIRQKHQNTRVRMIACGLGVRVGYYYLTDYGWDASKIARFDPGNGYHAQWVSKKTELSVIIVPYSDTHYRSLVNFVK